MEVIGSTPVPKSINNLLLVMSRIPVPVMAREPITDDPLPEASCSSPPLINRLATLIAADAMGSPESMMTLVELVGTEEVFQLPGSFQLLESLPVQTAMPAFTPAPVIADCSITLIANAPAVVILVQSFAIIVVVVLRLCMFGDGRVF